MKRVNSYEELSSLISPQLKKGVFTNCFVSKEELEFFIKKRRLFYQIFDGGLLIFQKMSGYLKLKFYINNFNSDLKINSNKKIVTEIAVKTENDFEILEKFFNNAGLNVILKRERFTQTEIFNVKNEELQNVEVTNLKDYQEIVKILRKNFDKYIGCIPSKEIIKQDIINKNFYCYRKDKKIVGILHVSQKLKTTEIKHLAVYEEYRGNNIAKSMLAKYLLDTEGFAKHVWTAKDNEVAKNLYSKFGYKPDGYVSIVLIKKA